MKPGTMYADDLDVIFWYANPTKYPAVPVAFRLKQYLGDLRAVQADTFSPECLDVGLTDGMILRPCREGEAGEAFWASVDLIAHKPECRRDEWRFEYDKNCDGIIPHAIKPLTRPYDGTRDEIPDYITWDELWLEIQARWDNPSRRPNNWRNIPRTFHPSTKGKTP